MPQDIVERLSSLMVEAGKTGRIQKLLDSMASTSPPKDTSRSRNCTTTKRPFLWLLCGHWGLRLNNVRVPAHELDR